MKIEKTLYEEAKIKCDCCGAEIFEDYYTNISGWDICKDCMAKSEDVDDLITLDNVLSYGASEKESVKINHLLYMLYDDDEVEEVLLNDLKKMPKDKLQEKLNWYVREGCFADVWEFVEFLDAMGDKDAKAIIESEVKYEF